MSLIFLIREFSRVDILCYGVDLGRGGFAHLAYLDTGYRGIRLVVYRQKYRFVIGRDTAIAAKACALSLESLGTCSSFHVEKPARCCLIRVTYFAIRGS